MNFQDLLSKMKQLDETASIEECGMMPPIGMPPKQSDSVTMSVNMNGSGAGGIKDLLGILKDIESGAPAKPHGVHGDDEIVIGSPMDAKMAELEDSYDNEPHPLTTGTNIVTGDDLASKGGEAEKVNGGGNPMGVDESLVARLSAHYQSVKEGYNPNSASAENRRNLDKSEHDRLKAAAEKDDATDADKARYQRYKDRKAATIAAYNARMER